MRYILPSYEDSTHFFENDISPGLTYAGSVNDDPNWSISPHCHPYCEIIYIASGEGRYIIDGVEYIGSAQDLIIFNKGIVHEEFSNPEKPLQTYFLGINNLHLRGLDASCLVPKGFSPIIKREQYNINIHDYIANILKECELQISGYDIMVKNLLSSLIIMLSRYFSSKASNMPIENDLTLAQKIKEYIDSNYSKDLSLASLSNILYLSPYYISHIFKNEIGNSPINYLIEKRIVEAKILLTNTDKSLSEIAGYIGYDNLSYFSTMFKKIVGMSPKQYRLENQGKTELT